MTCIKSDDQTPASAAGPNVGAIAGGVVGGVLVVAAVTFLIWWFFLRGKRQQYDDEWEDDDDVAQQKAAHERFNMQRSERASVNSVATSLLSRASNMIPIAYIPGVMNRDGRNNSNLNVPPVPPIPAILGPNSAHSSNGEALFFKPGDLRDSTYSDSSSMDDRSTFYGRPSITPSLARSSVGTFRDDAVAHPMPAQTIVRAKANMVSVSNSQKTSPENGSPQNELNGMNFSTSGQSQLLSVGTPNSSDSRGSLNSQGASFGKPTLLTLTKKSANKGRFPVKNINPAHGTKPIRSSPLAYKDDPSDSEDDETTQTAETHVTPIEQSPMHVQSPFDDPPIMDYSKGKAPLSRGSVASEQSRQSEQSFIGMGGLKSIAEVSSIIENATKRASRAPSHDGLGGVRENSPFGDEHEA